MVCSIAWWSFTKFVQTKVPGSKMAQRQGVLGLNHRNAKKYIQKSSSSEPLGLDVSNLVLSIASLVDLYQVCSNEGPRPQDGLWPGVPRLEP